MSKENSFITAAKHEIKKAKKAYNKHVLVPLIDGFIKKGQLKEAESQLIAEGFSQVQIDEILKPHESKE